VRRYVGAATGRRREGALDLRRAWGTHARRAGPPPRSVAVSDLNRGDSRRQEGKVGVLQN